MWKFVKTGTEGNCELFGIKIFEYKWENTGKKVEVSDPLYNKNHVFNIYNIDIKNGTVTFAAGEFSNNVYGFYILE